MSKQETTYTEVRLPKSSSESKNRVRLGDTQIPRETDRQERSVRWPCIAVALGVLCSLLLMAVVVVWVTQIQGKNKLQQSLKNISDLYHRMKNEKNSNEEMLKTKSKQCVILKHLREGIPYLRKAFCCGPKCYYFLEGIKTWDECKQTCQDRRFSLLKMDDSDEQNFLQNFLHTHTDENFYWIGLTYDELESKWKWIDKSTFNLTAMNSQYRGGDCAFFTATRIESSYCDEKFYCICEKRQD